MRVVLDFSLYMMRFGTARLAASFASPGRATDRNEISRRVQARLARSVPLSRQKKKQFEAYLKGKPGSRRYTPVRRQVEQGNLPDVEMQDLWLSEPALQSSVGSLTKNYFGDPLGLAQILQLTKKGGNVLLSRGLLSRYEPANDSENPFELPREQQLYLGLWLLDVDGDWIWTFLQVLNDKKESVIRVDNRVDILLETFSKLLKSKELRSGQSSYMAARSRLMELVNITERNVREGLNLGQPWSWFLVPRLELLVDATLLTKNQPDKLTGYQLSDAGRALQTAAAKASTGQKLLNVFFGAHSCSTLQMSFPPTWEEIWAAIEKLPTNLASSSGYYPLFETAGAVCVERCARRNPEGGWEVPQVMEVIRQAGGKVGPVMLGIDRRGRPNAFKPRS